MRIKKKENFRRVRFFAPFHTGCGPTQSIPRVKRPGRGVNHPPPSSIEGKERVEPYLYCPFWVFIASYRANKYVCFISNFFSVQFETEYVILLSLHITKSWFIALLSWCVSFLFMISEPTDEYSLYDHRDITGPLTLHISNLTQTFRLLEHWSKSDIGPPQYVILIF